jgi:hypothetical protein
MKKKIIPVLIMLIVVITCLFISHKLISTSAGYMKSLSIYQRIIPILYADPKNRIVHYISNANSLFSLSETIASENRTLALESALRAENGMTLVVSELWKIQDASIIPHNLLFETFTKQYTQLNTIRKNAGNDAQFDTVGSFMERNEKSAKTLYYKELPPEVPVLH